VEKSVEKWRSPVDTVGKLVVAVFTLAVGGVVVLLVIRECYHYFRGESLLDTRQFRFRMVGAGVLLGLLVIMCVGVYLVHFTDALTFAIFWSAFACCCLVPLGMSVVDLRRLSRIRREKQSALGKELAEFIREQSDLLQKQGSPPTGQARPPDE